jgi:uncharacterized protein (TIGR00255 family)
MIKSMTAYSRVSAHAPFGHFVIEIHSVNRKMLDMSIYLPKNFLCFDIEVRKWLSNVLERGQVTLRLTMQDEGGKFFSNSLVQLKSLKEGWEKLCRELSYDPKVMIDLSFLVNQLRDLPVVESKEEEEATKAVLKEAVQSALAQLTQMKETEGKALVLDIQKRLKIIEENISAIELKKEIPLVHFQKKLLERLKDIGQLHHVETEDRIAREVALLAEKMDITEELVRMRAHIDQFRNPLFSSEKAVGRTLDFLTQEMHREVNTLGVKSSASDISLCVLKIKTELDKIREQVQNIE